MQAADRRPRFFGSNGLWILIAGLGIVGAQVVVSVSRRLEAAPENRVDAVSAFLFGLGIGVVVIAAWKVPAVVRDLTLLRRFKDGIVLSCVRTPPLAQALKTLAEEGREVKLPTLFTAVATREGLSLYSSSHRAPAAHLPWSRVRALEVGEVEEVTRRSNALLVTLEGTTLPIVVTGAGLGGLYPQSKKRIVRMIDEIDRLRRADAAK